MKAASFTSLMKTIGSTQDEKIRTVINSALDIINEEENQNAETKMNNALEAFSQAKSAHTENMLKLNDINAAITRSEKERQNALSESAKAEQNFRTRFRELRGMMTPELKAEHSQRVAGRELAEDITVVIAELEDDKMDIMLSACTSGDKYVSTHASALSVYARNEWASVMKDIPPALIRAFVLRLRELEMEGEERPHRVLIQELGDNVLAQSRFYAFDMAHEPVISQIGLHRPALTGVDMTLYKSPAKRMLRAKELARKTQPQEVKP
ncbi:capsid protein [uncultured Cedecea sp.]|uniref:capsid protein n=1 Tax=uncultured Cedecea sp. TaxID=988762 RepID=UPI00262F175F|nr:capsid protein [uncultured Cedecea sp.]